LPGIDGVFFEGGVVAGTFFTIAASSNAPVDRFPPMRSAWSFRAEPPMGAAFAGAAQTPLHGER
jgi:hypothetical protein